MSFEELRARLTSGRPLVVDADTCASFRARGVIVDFPGAVGELLRKSPRAVLDHYRAEVESDVNVVCALTADTTPRALAEVGMQHRAAALTSAAVELAQEARTQSKRPIAIAGVLGSEMVAPMFADRLREELEEHAARIHTAGVELMLARGQGSRLELMTAVAAAAATDLPVWAILECLQGAELAVGGTLPPLLEALQEAGASAVLFEVGSIDDGLAALERVQGLIEAESFAVGVLLAGGPNSVRGFPDEYSEPQTWAARALELDTAGARVIGGGAGTTEAHTASLVSALRTIHPTIVPR
ncbi:MAG: homocysteine S-methyltransferase family protein [Polyangiaceae bacterium]